METKEIVSVWQKAGTSNHCSHLVQSRSSQRSHPKLPFVMFIFYILFIHCTSLGRWLWLSLIAVNSSCFAIILWTAVFQSAFPGMHILSFINIERVKLLWFRWWLSFSVGSTVLHEWHGGVSLTLPLSLSVDLLCNSDNKLRWNVSSFSTFCPSNYPLFKWPFVQYYSAVKFIKKKTAHPTKVFEVAMIPGVFGQRRLAPCRLSSIVYRSLFCIQTFLFWIFSCRLRFRLQGFSLVFLT